MAKLLIIEDDTQTTEYLEEFFVIRKCEVVVKHSCQEGLDHFKKHKPDVVLLDLHLNGESGLDIIESIKSIREDTSIIMMTVDTDAELKEKAQALGVDEFLRKPLNIETLEGSISSRFSKIFK